MDLTNLWNTTIVPAYNGLNYLGGELGEAVGDYLYPPPSSSSAQPQASNADSFSLTPFNGIAVSV